MKALLINPAQASALTNMSMNALLEERKLSGLEAVNPPLGLLTVAALLPEDWDIRLVDRCVEAETEDDWAWADLVMLSCMLDQVPDFFKVIKMAKERGKTVVVGGPYASAAPKRTRKAGADFLVLDEAEETLPLFLEALEHGATEGVFNAEGQADVTRSPTPRFDLVDLDAYFMATLQFSRGCPFRCEFCDIINIKVGGRRPRTKTHEQVLKELDTLYQLGWRRMIYLSDDNFIGNKKAVKLFLRDLVPWMEERGYPFPLMTEASINMAGDDELLELMVAAGFTYVFIGIEAVETDILQQIKKTQNVRKPIVDACRKITESGLQITAGFILGFDNEPDDASDRMVQLIEATAIPHAQINLLSAVPKAALFDRLQRERRLLNPFRGPYRGSPMNFLPTRPIPEIVRGFVDAYDRLYEPRAYLERCFRHFRMMKAKRIKHAYHSRLRDLRMFAHVAWRQGVKRPETRWLFWRRLFWIALHRRRLLTEYLTSVSMGESFFRLREHVKPLVATTDRLFGPHSFLADCYVPPKNADKDSETPDNDSETPPLRVPA
ncbi:MAG: DUF4070 domain-containing protein [Acidobacteriota bacterium]